jgi:IS5 family transposase
MPVNWSPAKRRQKDLDATWPRKHGKSHHGYKLSVNVDRRYKVIRKIETDTANKSHPPITLFVVFLMLVV